MTLSKKRNKAIATGSALTLLLAGSAMALATSANAATPGSSDTATWSNGVQATLTSAFDQDCGDTPVRMECATYTLDLLNTGDGEANINVTLKLGGVADDAPVIRMKAAGDNGNASDWTIPTPGVDGATADSLWIKGPLPAGANAYFTYIVDLAAPIDGGDRVLDASMEAVDFRNLAISDPFPAAPTEPPTTEPTVPPTVEPTIDPTVPPTTEPTVDPTELPTTEPTAPPTTEPTVDPTTEPTVPPTVDPTEPPTTEPTVDPTVPPTTEPTVPATVEPTVPAVVVPTTTAPAAWVADSPAPVAPQPEVLARTGASTTLWGSLIGLLVLGGGAGMVLVTRRRKSNH